MTAQWRSLMAFEIARNRGLYEQADVGIPMLPAASARCVGTARMLYAQILDRIEDANYDVFSARVRVPTWRKAGTSARIMITGPQPRGKVEGRRCRSGHELAPRRWPRVSRSPASPNRVPIASHRPGRRRDPGASPHR